MGKRRGPSRLTENALRLLQEAGFEAESEINVTTGYWRSQDVYRWDVAGKIGGIPHSYGCWQTLTEFVRLAKKFGVGFDTKYGEVWAYETDKDVKTKTSIGSGAKT